MCIRVCRRKRITHHGFYLVRSREQQPLLRDVIRPLGPCHARALRARAREYARNACTCCSRSRAVFRARPRERVIRFSAIPFVVCRGDTEGVARPSRSQTSISRVSDVNATLTRRRCNTPRSERKRGKGREENSLLRVRHRARTDRSTRVYVTYISRIVGLIGIDLSDSVAVGF